MPIRARAQTRNDHFVGIQEAFVDNHLRNVSERYDFDSIRIGIQPFSTDFRGFLFQDNQLGVRLFGTRRQQSSGSTTSPISAAWRRTPTAGSTI